MADALRLLIVDDDPRVARSNARLARALADVTTATGAEDALEILSEGTFYAVVTDENMPPGMSGLELLRIVRDRYPRVRRILTSGASIDLAPDSATVVQAFLIKPFDEAALRESLGL